MPLKIHHGSCRGSIENPVTQFFSWKCVEKTRVGIGGSKKMRVGRRLPLTIAIGFPCLRWVSGRNENGQNCEYFRNGKLYRCETNTFFFFKEREGERDLLVFNESSTMLRWISTDYLFRNISRDHFLVSFVCIPLLKTIENNCRSFIGD